MQHVLNNYVHYWENLSYSTIKDLEKLTAQRFVYKTPLYQKTGRRATQDVLVRVLKKMDSPCFIVKDKVLGTIYENTQYAYFRWTLSIKHKRLWVINGMTEIAIDKEKELVTSHIEHWDVASQVYRKLPVLGMILDFVKKTVLP